MKYSRIIAKVYTEPWLILPEKHQAIRELLESHLAGKEFKVELDRDRAGNTGEMQIDGSNAIIPIHGIIGKHLSWLEMACGGCSIDKIEDQLFAAANDPRVETIYLDINSPGGTVTGIPETAKLIADISESKSVVAFTDDTAASAAYWLGSQADVFYATPSSVIGSVGVYALYLDESAAFEREGIKVNAISSGKYKLMGANFRAMADDERLMIQESVDKIGAEFREAVQSKREIQSNDLEGQVYDGDVAANKGFVDGIVDRFEEVLKLTNK